VLGVDSRDAGDARRRIGRGRALGALGGDHALGRLQDGRVHRQRGTALDHAS
jgi:hypothetical protein